MNTSYLKLLQENCKVKNGLREQHMQDDDMELKGKIKQFFKDNPNPPDSEVHALADKLGIAPDELETKIYEILSMYLKIGKHQDVSDSKFDSNELSMGIDVEKEHTDCPMIAKEIAKDHLSEISDYYTRLKKMEEEGKKKE